jgi:lysylphosphatidylglycerol synthetase-like protein (DUF2156 family)
LRPGDAPLTLAMRRQYLLAYGAQANAYFHCQACLDYFHLPEIGFVSYYPQRGWFGFVPIVFAKPLCADVHLGLLLEAFLATQGHRAIFMGMDERTAAVLVGLGFTVNEFGAEINIPIQDYHVRGRAMKYLRTVLHNGTKGVSVRELPDGAVPVAELERISSGWLRQHRIKNRELRFLTRPPEFGPEWEVRKFYCFKDDRLVGFVFFDPFFRDGRCLGYCANILRCEPGLRPPGILDFAILTAMAKFREEGLETLSLGVCPLHGLERHPGEDRLLRLSGQQVYRWGSCLYNFKELAFHKSRFHGQARKLYFCKRGLGVLASLGLSLRATNIL